MTEFNINKINDRIMNIIEVLCIIRDVCKDISQEPNQDNINKLQQSIETLNESIDNQKEIMYNDISNLLKDIVDENREEIIGVETENGIEI